MNQKWIIFAVLVGIVLIVAGGIWYYIDDLSTHIDTSKGQTSANQAVPISPPPSSEISASSSAAINSPQSHNLTLITRRSEDNGTATIISYDVAERKIVSQKQIKDKNSTDGNDICQHYLNYPKAAASYWTCEGRDFSSLVKSRIPEGFIAEPYIISPDAKHTIFKVYGDPCAKNPGPCSSEVGNDIGYFNIYSTADNSVQKFIQLTGFPLDIKKILSLKWTHDGKYLYLVTGGNLSISIIDWRAMAYKERINLVLDPILGTHSPSAGTVLAFSPDDSKLIFDVRWVGREEMFNYYVHQLHKDEYSFYSQTKVYMLDLASRQTSSVIADGYEARGIEWSPNGTKFAIQLWQRADQVDMDTLQIINAKSLHEELKESNLNQGDVITSYYWSPEGEYMVYHGFLGQPGNKFQSTSNIISFRNGQSEHQEIPELRSVYFGDVAFLGWRKD